VAAQDGPCLAVVLNERQDYFGTTVTVAARVQALADSRTILATRSVVTDPQSPPYSKPAGSNRYRRAAPCAVSPTKSRSTRSREFPG
jgi:class 3 adenylate cyclase